MKSLFSKYSRFVFISLALCSITTLWSMEERPSQMINTPRQIRLAELDEYRGQLIKTIWIIKNDPTCDENTRANLSFFEESLKNVERELRLLLDPDIQNSAVTITYPIFQYIPVPFPMAMPMHFGIANIQQPISEQSQTTEINPLSEPAQSLPQPQELESEIQPAPQQTPELITQQEQIGGILKRPSASGQIQQQLSLEQQNPIKTYASVVATPAVPVIQPKLTTVHQIDTSHKTKVVYGNRLESQQLVETSKFKKTKTQQFPVVQDKKQATAQKEKKKAQITPEKQHLQHAPSTTQEKTEPKTPTHEPAPGKEHKAKKSEQTKTQITKQKEETTKKTEKEVAVQSSESEDETVDSPKSEPQTKKQPKLKQKQPKSKKKSSKATQSLDGAAASSHPQSKLTHAPQSEEMRLSCLWEHGIELLNQLHSIEDDTEKRISLFQAISLFEQVFSLRPDISSVTHFDMDQIEGLVKFLFECFTHNPLVQALIIRINLLTNFDFENILQINKHDFIQHFIGTISAEDASEQTKDEFKTLSSIQLVQGCLAINGIETERSESQALALLSKIIENQTVPAHIRTEAVELLAQIAIRLARGSKPNPEDIPLLKMCYKLIPHLVAYDNMQMAASAYIIAEQFTYEFFKVNKERIYSRNSGKSSSDPESWDIIISNAEQALQPKISTTSESSTQKKSKKQKDHAFTSEDKNELCALSALCFGKTLRYLKYEEELDSKLTKRFLEKAELYLDVLDVSQISRGNPFNFTLAKVYDILSDLVYKGVIDNACSLKYIRIACKLSQESKVYKFNFATKLMSLNPVTKQELDEAISLFKSLADEIKTQTRIDPLCVQAAFIFASLYHSGPAKPIKGFRTNEKLALEYLALAANAGHPDAIRMLTAGHDKPSTSSTPAATSSNPN